MSDQSSIALLSAAELRRRVAGGELLPVDVLDACLEQIDRHNGPINAVVTLDPTAREQAHELERRLAAGETARQIFEAPGGDS